MMHKLLLCPIWAQFIAGKSNSTKHPWPDSNFAGQNILPRLDQLVPFTDKVFSFMCYDRDNGLNPGY